MIALLATGVLVATTGGIAPASPDFSRRVDERAEGERRVGATEPEGRPSRIDHAVSTSGAGIVLEFADHLLDNGEPFRAAGEYERYLFLCGTCERVPYAERRLAETFRRGGRPKDAASRFAAVAAAHPGSPEGILAARSAAESLEEASAPGLASDAYREFARRHPDEPDAGEAWARALRTAFRAHDEDRVRAALETPAPKDAPKVDVAAVRADLGEKPSRRSPALAGVMSAVIPGSGHVYAGRARDGVMALIINALFISGAVIAYDHEQYPLAAGLAAAELFWYGGNVVGAVNAADRYNRRATDTHYKRLERKHMPAAASVSVRF